jgi:hypothetical protein
MKTFPRLICASLLLALVYIPITAQRNDFTGPLRGLRGVSVQTYVDGGGAQTVVTQRQIQTDVEIKLRRAGILVRPDGDPVLRVMILLHETPVLTAIEDLPIVVNYSVFLQVALLQKVQLVRLPDYVMTTNTWESMQLLVYPKNHLRDVRDDLSDLVDGFVNDFLAANPKP